MRFEGTVGADTKSCRANARIWSWRVLGVFQHNRPEAEVPVRVRYGRNAPRPDVPRQAANGQLRPFADLTDECSERWDCSRSGHSIGGKSTKAKKLPRDATPLRILTLRAITTLLSARIRLSSCFNLASGLHAGQW